MKQEELTKCYCGHTTTCDCGQEDSKQETLEKVAENYVDSFEFGIAHPRRVCKNAFINGAKWQQKKDIKELKPNPLLMDEVAHWDFRKSTVDKMKPLQEQWQQDMDKELMKKETLEDNIKNKIMGMNVDTGFRIERTYSDEDLELRKRLWVDVYIAYVSTPNSYNRDGGHVWADKALERFDEQFKKK